MQYSRLPPSDCSTCCSLFCSLRSFRVNDARALIANFCPAKPCKRAHHQQRSQGTCGIDVCHLPLRSCGINDCCWSRYGDDSENVPNRHNRVEQYGQTPTNRCNTGFNSRATPKIEREGLINEIVRQVPAEKVRQRHAKVGAAP